MGRIQSTIARIDRNRADILVWLIVAVTWTLGYLSYIRNLGLFFPDSRYYLAYSFLFGGESADAARDRTAAFAAQWHIMMPDTATTFGWGLVQPRVVLPFLSAPFVKLFGPYGLAVVPALATIAFIILVTILMKRRYGNVAAVATVVLMNASPRIIIYMTGMLTESLSALLSLIAVILAWRYMRSPRWYLLVLMGVVTVVSAFTRQATLIMAGAFVGAWLLGMLVNRRWRSPWMWPAIVVGGASLGSQLVQSIVWPFSQANQYLRMTGSSSLLEAIAHTPGLAWHLFVTDVESFMVADQALLIIFFLSIGAMILFWKHEEAHLLFGAMIAVALYNLTNGTASSFRYAIPGLVFYVLPIALMLQSTVRAKRSEPVSEARASVSA